MSESYLPWKMWGSWIGAIVGGLTWLFNPIPAILFDILKICQFGDTCYIQAIIIDLIIGSLIGWGIHSLVRYLSDR